MTFDTNHSVTDSTQTISCCFCPESSWFCKDSQHSWPLAVDVSGETIRLSISLRSAVDFLHVACIKYKHMLIYNFVVRVTVHRDKFPYNKPTRCTNFSKFILEGNSACFGQFLCPSSGVFYCTHSSTYRFADSLRASCQKTCVTYTIAVCAVKNFWWWTEELSETCRVSFQNKFWKISASSWFIIKEI